MKPTKMRNRQIHKSTKTARSRQVGSPLSKDLQRDYGRRSVRVVKGDTVYVTRGEFEQIEGKVTKVRVKSGRIAIEGIKKEKPKGDKFDVMIHASNVRVTGLNTDDSKRMAKFESGKKSKKRSVERKAQGADDSAKGNSDAPADRTDLDGEPSGTVKPGAPEPEPAHEAPDAPAGGPDETADTNSKMNEKESGESR